MQAYLKARYSDTYWLPLITSIRSGAGGLQVETKLDPDADGDQAGREICVAVSGYEIQTTGRLDGVRVAAANGERLVLRTSVADSCDPS